MARETNGPDPVNDSYEATTAAYTQQLNDLLSRSADRLTVQPLRQRIVVATHNLDTVSFVIKQCVLSIDVLSMVLSLLRRYLSQSDDDDDDDNGTDDKMVMR